MWIKKGLDYLLFFLLGLIPFITLVQFEETIYPYVTGKHFTFRFIILLAGAICFVLGFMDRRYRPHLSWLLKSFLVFLGIVFLADVLGSNFWNSFWSNYSRMEGFISLLFFLLFFLVLTSTLQTFNRWRNYWLIHVCVSLIVLTIAVLQKLHLMRAVDYNRVDSVFGNSSYLAIYASIIFFLCLYLYFSYRSLWLKGFVVFVAVGNLTSIYLSQTRSATLGVLLGIAFFIYSLAKNKKKALLYSAAIFLVFVVSVFFLKNRTSQASTNLFERIAQMSLQEGSIQARVEIWGYCLRAIAYQPFLGWGQESYGYLGSFYRPQLWSTPWVDRSHNIFLEWLINAGIFGCLALTSVLFLIVRGIWKADESKLQRPQKMALLGLFLCWLINQCLSIDFFSISILFYSLMAFVHFLQLKETSETLNFDPKMSRTKKIFLTLFFIGIGLVLNFQLNINGILKNMELRLFVKAENVIDAGKAGKYRELLRAMFDRDHESFELRELRVFSIQNALFVLNQLRLKTANIGDDYASTYYTLVDSEIQKQIAEDPEALFFKHLAANFYTQFQNFKAAEKLFDELLMKVPQQQHFWIDFGHFHLAQGRLADGLKCYRRAYELDPTYASAKMYLALGYIYNKQLVEGNTLTNELMKENKPDVFDERLVNAYLAMDQRQKVIEIMQYKDKFYGVETKWK